MVFFARKGKRTYKKKDQINKHVGNLTEILSNIIYTPTWDISLSLKKKYTIKPMLFLISMRKMESPFESIFFVNFGTCEKIEVKRGHLVKKWEFSQMKTILLYQFFKTRICAFMTYGQFLPKSSSNWKFVIQDSMVRGLRPRPRQSL